MCSKPIKMQIMKNTGFCREKCKEKYADKIPPTATV
jgi:hypothetical protein